MIIFLELIVRKSEKDRFSLLESELQGEIKQTLTLKCRMNK